MTGDDIPFDKSFDLPPGKVEEVAPGVRRLLANNPSPFTFRGTVSYIVGRGKIAIIDPGPLDDAHINYLLEYNTRSMSGNEQRGYWFDYGNTR